VTGEIFRRHGARDRAVPEAPDALANTGFDVMRRHLATADIMRH
jgi:hypothetical protein